MKSETFQETLTNFFNSCQKVIWVPQKVLLIIWRISKENQVLIRTQAVWHVLNNNISSRENLSIPYESNS